MQRHFDINMSQADGNESDASSSCLRCGMLFGSLALALALVLVPVYMKHNNSGLMDTQSPIAQMAHSSVPMAAQGAHNGESK